MTDFVAGSETPRDIDWMMVAAARAVLVLAKLNWNNDGLYNHLPVTMRYAKVLARVLKRMSHLGNAAYRFRFLM